VRWCFVGRSRKRNVTYHGDDFGLDGLVQGDEAEVGDEVELLYVRK
jgi:hypothetical protein